MIFIIAGRLKKHKLVTPSGQTTRPTLGKVRQTLFNICQHEIEGATFLDLFAGSGAIGLEALSRGAKQATFVEYDRAAIRAIETNISHCGVERESLVIRRDVFDLLPTLKPFDIIFADPPYGKGYGERILALVAQGHLVKSALFIEESTPIYQNHLKSELELCSCRKIGGTYLHHFVPTQPSCNEQDEREPSPTDDFL